MAYVTIDQLESQEVANDNDYMIIGNDDAKKITVKELMKKAQLTTDTTLTQNGQAADAAIVGGKFTNVTKKIDELEKIDTTTDTTLTVTGKAADSKIVGEKFKEVEKNVENLDSGKMDKNVLIDVARNTPHADTVGDFFDLKRTGKIYRTRIPLFATNPTTTCEKLLDNAGLTFTPSTDAVEGADDYLNGNHPMFEWWNCNYKRNDDGSPYPVAIEGEEGFSYTGNVDVGTIQMSFYYEFKTNTEEGYVDLTVSDIPHLVRIDMALVPWSECVKADGTVLPYCIGSKYISSIGNDGFLRSVKGGKPERNQSYNNMMSNYPKKGKGYHGAGAERNTFQIIFNLIKGAKKSSQELYAGCTNYNYQYSASAVRSNNDTYFPVTNAQANNLVVGSYVSVGYSGLNSGAATNDRGYGNLHQYADNVKILKIEKLDENNMAVYLDVSKGFNTTPVKLSDTVTSNIIMSTMFWCAGETDKVIGKHDGSPVSNTNGKFPYRVQGREYAVGAYTVASDAVMVFKSDYSKDVYVAQKGTTRTNNEATIKSTYKLIGNIPANTNGGDYWIGDIVIDTKTGGWFPSSKGSGSTQGFADMLYAGGASTSGTREFPQGGDLGSGSSAGSVCLACWSWLGGTNWYCCGCD